jgi:hypothetical protein
MLDRLTEFILRYATYAILVGAAIYFLWFAEGQR